MTSQLDHEQDLNLARAVVAGSVESWHAFVHKYSGLILAVARRYLGGGSRIDDVRSLYADVLSSLRRQKLAGYEGRCALSTWVVLVTRAAVVDRLRHERGGRELHEALEQLEPFEREVFRLYYIQGRGLGAVTRMARDHDAPVTSEKVLLALQRIEERIDGRLARRLRYDLYAQSVGASSGRLLEYMDHVKSEFEERAAAEGSDTYLIEREARRTLERVRHQIALLPPDEQRLLNLRFEQGWSARRIAEELGLDGQRTVYTVMDRIFRTLRRALGRDEDAGPRDSKGASTENGRPRKSAAPSLTRHAGSAALEPLASHEEDPDT